MFVRWHVQFACKLFLLQFKILPTDSKILIIVNIIFVIIYNSLSTFSNIIPATHFLLNHPCHWWFSAWWYWHTGHIPDNEENGLAALSLQCWRIFASENQHSGCVMVKRSCFKLLAHPILFHKWGASCQWAQGGNWFPSGGYWTPFSWPLIVLCFVVMLAFLSMLSTSLLSSPCHKIKIDEKIWYDCTQHDKYNLQAITKFVLFMISDVCKLI